ncbi:MAG: hypothetical protein L0H93_06375 [Nocardioides sp.]|nr:hypothetical protein [Nocardioides sp.]
MIAIPEPELSPAQNEEVRRLLADARHEEPMPADVASRLDGVIADLGADLSTNRAAGPAVDPEPPASVTPLRRRSKLPQALLAAAAVVAVGFGITQVLPSGEDGAGDAGSESPNSSSLSDDDPGAADQDSGAAAPDSQRSDSQRTQPRHLGRERSRTLLSRVPLSGLSPGFESDSELPASSCGPRRLAEGQRRAAATYQGQSAVVIFHPVNNGERTADVYVCGRGSDSGPLTSVTLTGP